MDTDRRCRRCGSSSIQEWLDGLCPVCILEFGLSGYDEARSSVMGMGGESAPTDYEILEEIGSGGMGIVYRALQISLNRTVALKKIRPELLKRRTDVLRFRAEAETSARLSHPNIVAIYEVGDHAGQPFYSMEFIEGKSLAQRVREGPLPPVEAARQIRLVAQAIEFAHQKGVLHRDLKPSNILIDLSGNPRVLDFGLAKVAVDDSDLTQTGAVIGTPSYLPPEQAKGGANQVDARADIYALGAVLYESLTGHPPFRAASPLETLQLVISQDPIAPRLLNSNLPRDLETICLKCLAKEPAKRYQHASDLADDIKRFLDGEPIQARPDSASDKAVRWARRHPTVAVLSTALVLTFLAGFFGVTWEWRRAMRAVQRETAESLRAKANEMAAIRNLYANDVNSAQQAIEKGDYTRARDLLSAYIPPRRHEPSNVLDAAGNTSMRGDSGDLRNFAWRYFWQQAQGDAHELLIGHTTPVRGLAFSRDGQKLYSASFDGGLRAWSVADRSCIFAQSIAGLGCSSLSLHPFQDTLAIGGGLGSSGRIVVMRDRSMIRLAPEDIQQLAYSPTGQWLASGNLLGWGAQTNGTTGVLNLEGQTLVSLPEAGGYVAFSADGRYLATGSWLDRIKIWACQNSTDGKPIPKLAGELGPVPPVTVLQFTPDGKRLLSGHSTGEILLWDIETRLVLVRQQFPTTYVRALAISPDGSLLASGSDEQMVRVSETTTLKPMWRYRGNNKGIWSLQWSPDAKWLVSGNGDGEIALWPGGAPVADDLVLTNILSHFFSSEMVFSPDSRWIAAPLRGGSLGLWDVESLRATTRVGLSRPSRMVFSADSSALIVASGWQSVQSYRVPDLMPLRAIELEQVTNSLGNTCLSPNGRWVASAGVNRNSDGTIFLWDVSSGKIAAQLQGHKTRVFGLRFSPDNRWLASGSLDKSARIWNLSTFRTESVLEGHRDGVTVLSFNPESSQVATTSWDMTAKIWRIPEGALLSTLTSNIGVPVSEFLPDGNTLAIMTDYGGIRLVDLNSRRDTGILKWPGSLMFRYVRSSPDGQTLAAFSNDGRIRLWRGPHPH